MTHRSRRAWLIPMSAMIVAGLVASAAVGATKAFTGSLAANGTSWRAHRFVVTGSGPIEAVLNWPDASANLNLFLYDPAGTRVAQAVSLDRPETITYQAGVSGTWKLGIKAASGATDYTLDVSFPSAASVIVPQHVRRIGGGAAGHAEMYPSGLDVDDSGNVYVADTGDDQIQKFDPNGDRLWVVGTRGPRAPGRFENPRDVAVLAGKVYVADTGYNRVQVLDAGDGSVDAIWGTRFGTIMGISAGLNGAGDPVILVSESSANTIRVYSPGGVLLRSVGTGPGNGPGQLNAVRDAATDASGNIFAADYANSRVVVFGPLGGALDAWGVNGTGPQQLKRPYGIELDTSGNVYVADSNNYVHKFTRTGGFIRTFGAPGDEAGRFQMLRRVALGPGDSPSVYGADLWTYKIEMFDQTGAHIDTIGGQGPAEGFFNEPYGLAVDAQDLLIADQVNQRIQRFGATSPFPFQLAWGARGWGEGNPGFNWPRDAASGVLAGSKTVWVADTKNNRFTEFWPDGSATGRRFGTGGSGVGQFNWPHAVASVGSDLVIANTKNHRIERWDPSEPSVVWAVGDAGSQALSSPKDVAVMSGEVFVADTQNNRIVVLAAGTGASLRQFGGGALHRPEGIAVEPNGDVWVADTGWHRLVEFSPTGVVHQVFGSFGETDAKFNKPAHLEVLSTGGDVLLFVVDSWNDRVQVYDIG